MLICQMNSVCGGDCIVRKNKLYNSVKEWFILITIIINEHNYSLNTSVFYHIDICTLFYKSNKARKNYNYNYSSLIEKKCSSLLERKNNFSTNAQTIFSSYHSHLGVAFIPIF